MIENQADKGHQQIAYSIQRVFCTKTGLILPKSSYQIQRSTSFFMPISVSDLFYSSQLALFLQAVQLQVRARMCGLTRSSFSCSFFSMFRRHKDESLQQLRCNPRMDVYSGPVTTTKVLKWLLLLRVLEQCLKSWSSIIIDRPVT